MKGLRCDECGAVWLSAHADEMLAAGETCLQCSGRLILMSDEELAAAIRAGKSSQD